VFAFCFKIINAEPSQVSACLGSHEHSYAEHRKTQAAAKYAVHCSLKTPAYPVFI